MINYIGKLRRLLAPDVIADTVSPYQLQLGQQATVIKQCPRAFADDLVGDIASMALCVTRLWVHAASGDSGSITEPLFRPLFSPDPERRSARLAPSNPYSQAPTRKEYSPGCVRSARRPRKALGRDPARSETARGHDDAGRYAVPTGG